MPIDSRFGCLWKCLGVVFHNKKDVETVPVTRSTTEAVGIAHLVRTSNSRPHADMTTQYTLLYNKISLMIFHKRQMTIRVCELSYPWASIIAMLLDKMLKSFLRFQWSENKARDKRLFHIWLSSKRFPTTARNLFPTCSDSQMPSFTHYRREDVAKVAKK